MNPPEKMSSPAHTKADPFINPSQGPTSRASKDMLPLSVIGSPTPPARTKRVGLSPLPRRRGKVESDGRGRSSIISEELKGGGAIEERGNNGGRVGSGSRLGEATHDVALKGGVGDPPQRR